MKTIKFLLVGLMTLASFETSANEISVKVKGMVCGFCAQGIEKKFKALPEVSSVDVSLEKKIVKISTKEKQDIPDSKIVEILKEAGYSIENSPERK